MIKIATWKDVKTLHDVISTLADKINSGEVDASFGVDEQNFYEEVINEYEQSKKKNTAYLTELAKGLRELWPTGSKDGKFEWRSSVSTLVDRLTLLWDERGYEQIPIEKCLSVARRYLSSYSHDTTYMQTLQYYIWKQKNVTVAPGRIKHVSTSKFGDMLDGKADEDAVQNEWEQLISDASIGEGVLI